MTEYNGGDKPRIGVFYDGLFPYYFGKDGLIKAAEIVASHDMGLHLLPMRWIDPFGLETIKKDCGVGIVMSYSTMRDGASSIRESLGSTYRTGEWRYMLDPILFERTSAVQVSYIMAVFPDAVALDVEYVGVEQIDMTEWVAGRPGTDAASLSRVVRTIADRLNKSAQNAKGVWLSLSDRLANSYIDIMPDLLGILMNKDCIKMVQVAFTTNTGIVHFLNGDETPLTTYIRVLRPAFQKGVQVVIRFSPFEHLFDKEHLVGALGSRMRNLMFS